MFALFLAASALAAPGLPATHATVEHRGQPLAVRYTPRVRIAMKTVGAAPGARMTTQRCAWQAAVHVERVVADGAHARLLPAERTIEGSRHGDCETNGVAVADDIARRVRALDGHVEQVAAADRGTLIAELEAARGVARN